MQNGERKSDMRKHFTAKRIAFMAVFVALSYVVSWIEIPIVEPFKLDFGNVFILLVAFLFGPVEGVVVCALKEALRMIGSSSGGVGELANMLVTCSYILVPSLVYRFKKGLKWVIPCLVAACLIATATALLTNRFINFPLYMGDGAAAAFENLFWVIVGFNLGKTVAVSVVTVLLYKRLSNFLKKWEQ
jgi:riboflavin transporter FmnP